MRSIEACAYCGHNTLAERLVTRSFGRGESLLVIKDIPLKSCGKCGEAYFTAETMHEIERVKVHRLALASERKVAVAGFA